MLRRSPGACRSLSLRRPSGLSPRSDGPRSGADLRPLMPSLKLPYEAATRASTDPFRCRGGVSRTPGNLPDRLLLDAFGPSLTIGAGMHRAAVEERPALDGKRLVMKVANAMRLRLKNDDAPWKRPPTPPCPDAAAGSDG